MGAPSVRDYGSPRKIFAIVVNRNGRRYLNGCLSSLSCQTISLSGIILVDNDSSDGSVEYVQEEFASVEVLSMQKNLGFAEGNNVAIRRAIARGASHIVLVNNDTIAEPDLIARLIEPTQFENVGIVGARVLLLSSGAVQEIGMSCDYLGFPVPIPNAILPRGEYIDAFYVGGCAMAITRQVVEKVGVFDSDYFMFAEDLDLCWRARLNGYKVVANPKAVIKHVSGGTIIGGMQKTKRYVTSPQRLFLRERNTLRTLVKNYAGATLLWVLPLYLIVSFAETVMLAFINPWASVMRIKAILWNLRHIRETLTLRREVQDSRLVGDSELLRFMYPGVYRAYFLFRPPRFVNK